MLRWKVSTRGLMILVALIAVGMAGVRQLYFANTVYSANYSEGRFGRIQEGMTTNEVESLVGQPLRKVPQLYGVPETALWMYSVKRHGGGDYWLRNVYFQSNKVVNVAKMYWID